MADLDRYSYHEALDRTHIQLIQLEASLGDHPVIQSDAEIRALYEKSIENLSQVYQILGSKSCES